MSMNAKLLSIITLMIVMFGGIYFVARSKKSQNLFGGVQTRNASPLPTGVAPEPTNILTPGGSVISSEITLTISSPVNGAMVTNPAITVRGTTKPGAEVFVNDVQAKADTSGNFSAKLTLDEGDNPIVVSVNDADGNVAEKELNVVYDSGL